MAHFIRSLHMHIHKVISILQNFYRRMGFSFIIGIQSAIGPVYCDHLVIEVPTAIPFSRSTAEIMAPFFPFFSSKEKSAGRFCACAPEPAGIGRVQALLLPFYIYRVAFTRIS